MSRISEIRERLNVTQTELADALDCTQGNIGHYEGKQALPYKRAKLLIEFAATLGLTITFDHIYGTKALPKQKAKAAV